MKTVNAAADRNTAVSIAAKNILEKCEAAATLRMKFRQIREAARKTQAKGSGKVCC